jgi:hypothetical protein
MLPKYKALLEKLLVRKAIYDERKRKQLHVPNSLPTSWEQKCVKDKDATAIRGFAATARGHLRFSSSAWAIR